MKKKEFEKIVKDYSKKLYNYLLKFHKNKEDAEDVLQSTFIEFYKQANKKNIEHHSAYLYRTAHNKSINLKNKNRKISPLNTDNYSETKKIEETQDSPKTLQLKKVLHELSPKHIQVIELKYYQNKRYKEIAEIMNITESAVESLLVRARKKIKIKMQDFDNNSVLKGEYKKGGLR